MANINLTTSDFQKKEGLPYKKGIVTIVVILAVMIGVYVWLMTATDKVTSNIGTANNAYGAEYNQLISNNKDIIDFQNRITTAKNLLAQPDTARESLSNLEKSILPGVSVGTYAYGKNTVTLDIVADNFDVLARQILNFKQSNYFSGVTAGKAALNDKNKVATQIILGVN